MGNFILPDGPPVPPPLPLDPRVAREEKIANDTRVESELNRFIASRQDAMFNNPDAFYRTQGEAAIHASPVTTKNLEQLRSDLLDSLANDYQRKRLGAALDAQMRLTRRQMPRRSRCCRVGSMRKLEADVRPIEGHAASAASRQSSTLEFERRTMNLISKP